MEIPAVSIIIPLYNVEKYIADCLESVLAQTFRNFEVIVVDDCSTDSSCAIVESYKEKFGGRLKLRRTKNNSGGCAVPRNFGLPFSNGEYVLFLDADDAITPTALEELYSIAKKFDADIVHCEKFYKIQEENWNDLNFIKQLRPYSYKRGEFVTAPTLLTEEISARVESFQQRKFIHSMWANLIRRDFILDNEMIMPNMPGQDMIFTMCALCVAKKFVLVPNVINLYRVRENSISTEKISEVSKFRKWLRALRLGFEYLDEFLNEHGLSQQPNLKYLLFDTFLNEMCRYFNDIYRQVPLTKLDEFLREEFAIGNNLALMAFTFNVMNLQRLHIMQNRV